MPQLPSYIPQVYRSNSNLAEMIMRRGEQQANAQRDLYGGIGQTIAGLGAEAGNLIGQRQEQKKVEAHQAEMSKRDAAWVSYVESGEWTKDPAEAYKITTRIWGAGKEAEEHFNGLQGAAQLMQPKRNPEADAKSLGAIIGAIDATPEGPGRARLYQAALPLAKNAFPDLQVEPEYNPETWSEKSALGKQLRGEKPAEAASPKVVGKSLVSPEGKLIYRDPDAPKEPKETKQPNWEDAVGPDGKPILFDRASGQTKAYPAGVGPKVTARERAVTGQERTVLGFYNRAKEATENIAPLEEKIAELGLAGQTRLKYAANFLQTDEGQAYNQAQKQFTEARLRKESGAAIAASEYENDRKTYFAEPGDGKKVLEQKRKARETVLRGLQIGAGAAYKEFYGEQAPRAGGTDDPLGFF